ncbi:efflux RND transporter permease subunit, partial [Sphingobium aquiterrae]|uniref:efflux RND transporter permease subunit n=1 Tax=Sphingobium aquiterrae TaxID=2038656 RepID=UPI003019B4DA
LAISAGAGAGGQNAIGRSVVGGMLTATVLAIFFVPMFFLVVKKLFRQDAPRAPEPSGGKDAPPSSLEPQEA